MRYLIKLEPIESFFFGGERTFENKNSKGERLHYIVKSRNFPQQTAILGMLRKEILKQKGYLKANWDYTKEELDRMKKVIGPHSFNITSKIEQDFGIIEGISPVFLYSSKENKFYIKMPKDQNLDNIESKSKYVPFTFYDHTIKSNLGQVNLPKDYKSKKGLSNQFISFDGESVKEYNDVFKEDKRVGNKKEGDNQFNDNSLFKKISFVFNNEDKLDFSFCFYLNLKDTSFELQDSVVYLGAFKSAFKMKVEQIDFNLVENITLNQNNNKLILLGDTYIDDINKYCRYSILNIVDFRNRLTKHSSDSKKHNYTFNRIDTKFAFLQRGSVLYPKSEDELELKDKLSENRNMTKIGYNIYLD